MRAPDAEAVSRLLRAEHSGKGVRLAPWSGNHASHRSVQAKHMLKVISQIESFHPAIAKSIEAAGGSVDLVLNEVNEVLKDFDDNAEHSGSVATKTGKKDDSRTVKLTAKGKLPKTPAGNLVRINDYLVMSAELYLKVEAVELPLSVQEWIGAKRFAAVA